MADYAKCRKNTWCKMPEGHPDECYPKPDGMRLLTGKELAVLQGTPRASSPTPPSHRRNPCRSSWSVSTR